MPGLLSQPRLLQYMRQTPVILAGIVGNIDPHTAQKATDGPDGWNIPQVVGHLIDYEALSTTRVQQIMTQDNPTLVMFDPPALVIEHGYAQQDVHDLFARWLDARRSYIALLGSIAESDWERPGVHAVEGPTTLRQIAANTSLHDLNHIDQIVRALELTSLKF